MKKLLISAVLMSATFQVSAANENIWSPDQNVLCDKIAGFCADNQGISVTYTQEYLGQKAANKLINMGEFDMTRFTLSNGAKCDVNLGRCVDKNTGKIEPISDSTLFHQ